MNLEVGDLLKFKGALGLESLYHYGVYVGDNQVVHMWASMRRPKADAVFQLTTLSNFSALASKRGVPLEVERVQDKLPAAEIQRRCMSIVGQGDYHVFYNNCEHLARYCVTGDRRSHQVDAVFKKQTGSAPSRPRSHTTRHSTR
jgi:hypothetical protein